MGIFELATRKKFRFASSRGPLTVEDLWDLPLIAGSGITRDIKCDLDTVARQVNGDLKAVTEESFVAIKPDPRKPELEAKLEIVKFVIAAKIKAQEDAKAAKDRAEQRRKLVDALVTKDDEKLKSMTREQIEAELAKLDAPATETAAAA